MAKPKTEIHTHGARPPMLQNRSGNYLRNLDSWSGFFAAVGWNNPKTGRGIQGTDRRLDTGFAPKGATPESTLRAMYRGDGMARRVIDLPVELMTSQGFDIMGDPDGMVLARMEENGILKSLEEMVRWSRLFGGALGVINVDDSQLYDTPLNIRNIRKVYDVKVFNRWRVMFTTSDLYQNPYHPKFGKPEFYWVQPLMGRRFRVHESRTIRMDGAPVDDLTALQNQGWGDSYLECCMESLSDLASVYDSCNNIIDEFITSTLSLTDLAELMAQPDGEKIILKRLRLLDQSKSIANTRLLSDGEVFNKVASTITGLPDMVDRYVSRVAHDSGFPKSALVGDEQSGLNSDGDANMSKMYDKMEAEQQKTLRAPIEYLTRLIYNSTDDYFNGQEPKNWWIEFRKLWQPTAKQQTEMNKIEVDTVAVLVDRNIISPDEAREYPAIKERYNLEGPAPAPPDPVADPNADPNGEGASGQADKVKATDSLPADPVQARADIMGACRFLLRDSRGRRRGDSAQFLEQVVVLQRSEFKSEASADAWIKAHGFRADHMEETRGTYRYLQRGKDEFIHRSEKYITPTTGIEVVLGRLKDA